MTTPTPQQNDGSYFDSLVPRVTRADLEREMAKVVIRPKNPEQMRELADKQDRVAAGLEHAGVVAKHERAMSAALRTAAAQLEAVQADRWSDGWKAAVAYFEIDAEAFHALTADTAPQGDRDA